MREVEVSWPEGIETERMAQCVEKCAQEQGLVMTLRGVLRSYPGSIHWHWKRGKERGVLEITLWPQTRRLWFSVQARRTAAWIDALLPVLRTAISNAIGGVHFELDGGVCTPWCGPDRHEGVPTPPTGFDTPN